MRQNGQQQRGDDGVGSDLGGGGGDDDNDDTGHPGRQVSDHHQLLSDQTGQAGHLAGGNRMLTCLLYFVLYAAHSYCKACCPFEHLFGSPYLD